MDLLLCRWRRVGRTIGPVRMQRPGVVPVQAAGLMVTAAASTAARRSRGAPALFVALLLAVAAMPIPGLADPVDLVNAARIHGCGEYAGTDRLLQRNERLDAAARSAAGGVELGDALSAAGYRMKTTASIEIRTDGGDARVAEILAGHFCDDVTNRAFSDIGVYRDGYDLRLILAEPFMPPRPDEMPAVAGQVLALVNAARARQRRCGSREHAATTPLVYSTVLEHAALAHAMDMAANDFMGHQGSDGNTADFRATRAGYDWLGIGENVAAGQTSAEEVVNGWLASPSHCATLMDPRYSETGIAFALNPDSEHGIYWAQAFGRPR
jgi:uncharacterized protein YkwD